eukprot:5990071-Prymnesium_polylepis.1
MRSLGCAPGCRAERPGRRSRIDLEGLHVLGGGDELDLGVGGNLPGSGFQASNMHAPGKPRKYPRDADTWTRTGT